MRIRRLQLANFRGVAKGTVAFLGHTVIIGGNSVGKSTMCEALDLLLGPDRLSRRSPIDEHDFFERRYLDEDGVPIPIEMEVVLTDLTDDVLTRFRTHREYWNTATSGLLDETATPEDVDGDDVVPALRIRFEGVYDVEEDEFRAETYFASPPPDDGIRRTKVSRAAKRLFGFIYLRALRTGTRALSLERGSLLDVILKLKDDDRSAMWEQTLASMEHLDPAIDAIPQLKEILDDIHTRVRRFVGLSTEDRAFRLYPSALTRESLRRSITLFGSSERSNTPVPYWRLGSGVVNSMVFSLLTFIAELKSNVIFAMEEPEIAIPPHTQRRIVQFLRTKMAQSILTTHSPFVLEQYDPADVVLLERGSDGVVAGRRIEVAGIKAKTYKGNLRRVLAEAMLGNGVLCVEGISDGEAIYTASAVLEEGNPSREPTRRSTCPALRSCSAKGTAGYCATASFSRKSVSGHTRSTISRRTTRSADEIDDVFDATWELEQTGIEYLLADETTIDVIRRLSGGSIGVGRLSAQSEEVRSGSNTIRTATTTTSECSAGGS